MFGIEFYEDRRGRSPVREFLDALEARAASDRSARIQLRRINLRLDALREKGTRIGEPAIKHIGGDLWELRPLPHRIFFFYWRDNAYVLLHYYLKKTEKTPARELAKAVSNMNDYRERHK